MAQSDDEITLKDIILKIQEWFSTVWPKKNIIIAVSLAIGLMAALYTKFIAKPTYSASYQLFFEEEGGGMSGAMRLASSSAGSTPWRWASAYAIRRASS